MTINCPICLDILSTQPFGCIAPCGHYFHEECYNGWAAMSLKNNSRYNCTKCPSCNTVAGSFVRSFLDLEKLGQGLDDISISDSDSSSCDEGSKDGSVERSSDDDDDDDHSNSHDDEICLDNSYNVENVCEDRRGSMSSCNIRKRSVKHKTISDVIVMLDNDSESDIDDGDHNDVEKSSLSRSGDLQRKVSIGSSSQRSSFAHANKRSSDAIKGGKKMDTQRLEKKYKRIKKQLLAAKETVAKTYEESNQHMKLQLKYQDMKKSYREMERKYVDQLFQTTGYEREVRQLKENLEKLQQETKSLKKKILMNWNEFDKEKERLKNIAESIKVGNMQEMKLIIEQNKQLKRQNLEIVQNLKTMSMEKNEVDKLNARLKMKLNEGKKDCLMNQSDDIKSKKATSKSKMVELFRESIKEAEDNHRREQEEEILLKRQMDRKNMIRKSSTQTSRVLAAVTLQKRLKLKLAPKPSNTVSTIKSKEKAQHVGGVRKRPASQDLRHLFVKKR